MPVRPLRLAANCSLLFTELPLEQRAAAAARAGFAGIELWWPWPESPVPADADVDRFVASVRDAGVVVVGLNLYAGDLAGPDCGVLSIPSRRREFVDSLDVSAALATALDVHAMNALYGARVPSSTPAAQDALALEHLALAADVLGAVGTGVLLEPLSGPKPYPLRTAADVVAVLNRLGRPEVGLLLDLYHLGVNGDDLDAVVATHADRVTHVQVADAPGRHEPGSGVLDLAGPLDALLRHGYDGWVALEYVPAAATLAGLAGLRPPVLRPHTGPTSPGSCGEVDDGRAGARPGTTQ